MTHIQTHKEDLSFQLYTIFYVTTIGNQEENRDLKIISRTRTRLSQYDRAHVNPRYCAFSRRSRAKTTKKYTKTFDARAKLLFCLPLRYRRAVGY